MMLLPIPRFTEARPEIFQGAQPVLVGIDAASTYCYLLKSAEHRDEDTWDYHLLDVMEQGFDSDYTIADGGGGLRSGQKAVMPETPCHGDIFHVQHQLNNCLIVSIGRPEV